jgi:hypothetical protein
MSPTPWVAWVGACTGVASLIWNIYKGVTTGPRLRVTALANMLKMPSPPGKPRFLRVTVQNFGNATTTITNLCFHRYDSFWKRIRNRPEDPSAVLNTYQGPQLPHKMDAGTEWVAVMQQDESFDEWMKSGVLWCAVVHSFSKKPVQVKIVPGPDSRSDSQLVK